MKKYGTSPIRSYINKESKCYEVTLEQLEDMKLSPFMERALFGRTSKEWSESLKQ